MMMLFGGIELGGTKMVCAIGNEEGQILDRHIVPTTEPDETMNLLFEFFRGRKIAALGIGSFGPVNLNRNSDTYGHITTTPKSGWKDVDVLKYFKPLNVPLGFDTDVNAACLGEVTFGAGKGKNNVVYGTVGTGIGFGVYLDGKLLHGLQHPEAGHMIISRHEMDKAFHGPCPYHDNCLETFASGPSISIRWNKQAYELYDDQKVWKLEAYYLGQAVANCIVCYSPERVILGGGVMHAPGLIELVREETLKNLNGYIQNKEILDDIEHYIVLPSLKDDSGIIGAIELGRRAIENEL